VFSYDFDLFHKAQTSRPGKPTASYLRLILLTKPPFDFQLDPVIDEILQECKTIDSLSAFVEDFGKEPSLWENRERNLSRSKDILTSRNNTFFDSFWNS